MRALISGAHGNVGGCLADLLDSRSIGYDTVSSKVGDWSEIKSQINGTYDLVVLANGVQEPVALNALSERGTERILWGNLTFTIGIVNSVIDRINKGGLIVFCSSIQATQPRYGRGVYAAAKAGVEGLMRATAVELFDERNARAVALRIGQMTTQMKNVHFDERQKETLKALSPLEWVTPESVAKLCLDLYYQPSLTGTVIEVSSGQNLNIWN